jgi:hypothetical protein
VAATCQAGASYNKNCVIGWLLVVDLLDEGQKISVTYETILEIQGIK